MFLRNNPHTLQNHQGHSLCLDTLTFYVSFVLPTGTIDSVFTLLIQFIANSSLDKNFALKVAESVCPVIWRKRPFLYYRVVLCSCQVGLS